MRTIQTFLLRLLVDASHPEELRGALQAAGEDGQSLPFRNDAELIVVVRQLSAAQCKNHAGVRAEEETAQKN